MGAHGGFVEQRPPRGDHAGGHPVGGEALGGGPAVDPRIRAPPGAGAAPRARRRASHGEARRALDPGQRHRVRADRGAERGTSHADASITASPMPSSCDGTSTALAALIQYGTSSAGTPPSVSSGTSPAASCARSKRLSGRDGSCGNSRYGPSGSSPSRSRASARGIGRKRVRSTPHGQHRDAPRRARAGHVLAERARDRGGQRHERQRRARDRGRERGCSRSLPCSVTTSGRRPASSAGHASRPKWTCTTSKRSPAVAPAQLARRARVVARARPGTRTARPRRRRAAAAPRPGRARTARTRAARASGTCS